MYSVVIISKPFKVGLKVNKKLCNTSCFGQNNFEAPAFWNHGQINFGMKSFLSSLPYWLLVEDEIHRILYLIILPLPSLSFPIEGQLWQESCHKIGSLAEKLPLKWASFLISSHGCNINHCAHSGDRNLILSFAKKETTELPSKWVLRSPNPIHSFMITNWRFSFFNQVRGMDFPS